MGAMPDRRVAFVALALLCGCASERCSRRADGGGDASLAPSSTSAAAPATASASAEPEVVTQASAAWDAGPSVLTKDAIDGVALRRASHARIAGDKTAVSVLEGTDLVELGKAACEAVIPRRPASTPVLVKPNIGGFEWFKDPAKSGGDDGVRGRTTDPELVRGIVRCLKARGHTRVTVAEGWGATHADWERLVRVTGYATMTREEGVPLVAMDDDGVFDVEGDAPGRPLGVTGMEKTHAPTLLVPKILAEHLDHGLFVSVPKLKAHRFGVVSVGVKGMQGTVMLSDASPAFRQKWRMHKELGPALTLLKTDPVAGRAAYLSALEVFAERMTDVLEISAPHAVIADGAPAMGGDGFRKLWPSRESFVVAGTNPIAVDRVAAQALGLWDNAGLAAELGGHRTSPLVETAAKRFGVDLSSVEISGNGAHLLASPRPVHFVSMSGFELHSDGASPGSPDTFRRSGVAVEPSPANPAPADGERVAHALHFDVAPTIDGVRDAAWDQARPVSWDTDWSGAPGGPRTTARVGWSATGLFALFELEGAEINVDTSRPVEVERERLYQEDCVEIFVGADARDRQRYFEVEVGPRGHFFDLSVDRRAHKSDAAWSSVPTIATKVDVAHKRATIEVALRSPDVLAALKKGARLPFALYRMEGKAPRLYLAWSPTRTPKPNFHVPERFGALVLD